MQYHPSWQEITKIHFEKCIKAHGGWNDWNSLSHIEFNLLEFSGGLVIAKGLNKKSKIH
jgi:hypothetical protein